MRRIPFICVLLLFAMACKKEESRKVDIYMLKSFTSTIDQSTLPATISITDAVLEDVPIIADNEIRFYKKATTTFTVRKDIHSIIKNFGPDRAFAVTVDKVPVYYGRFHPLYLSSIAYGVATIAPMFSGGNELKIDFALLQGSTILEQLDKRNDSRILGALDETGRLR